MSWLTRHVLALGILVFALAIVGTVFTFARPQYRPTSYYSTVDMAHEHAYTVAEVRHAFAAQQLALGVMSRVGTAKHGIVNLGPSTERRAPPFTVALFGAEANVSFGPPTAVGYEARLGNVDMLYGSPHPNAALLDRIKAAVADLQQ